jgi:hypothetical protein
MCSVAVDSVTSGMSSSASLVRVYLQYTGTRFIEYYSCSFLDLCLCFFFYLYVGVWILISSNSGFAVLDITPL